MTVDSLKRLRLADATWPSGAAKSNGSPCELRPQQAASEVFPAKGKEDEGRVFVCICFSLMTCHERVCIHVF